MATIYPTFTWKDFAMRCVRAIEEEDTDGMEDVVKDARLFAAIPCPAIVLGGPNGGLTAFCCARDVEPGQCDHADAEDEAREPCEDCGWSRPGGHFDECPKVARQMAGPVGNLEDSNGKV